MNSNKKKYNYNQWENFMVDIVRKIEDDGHRRRYLDFLRKYGIIKRAKLDEIALEYGLKYHSENNSYWWV